MGWSILPHAGRLWLVKNADTTTRMWGTVTVICLECFACSPASRWYRSDRNEFSFVISYFQVWNLITPRHVVVRFKTRESVRYFNKNSLRVPVTCYVLGHHHQQAREIFLIVFNCFWIFITWCRNSPATPLFVQLFGRTPKKSSRLRVTESLWGESIGRWIPLTKGQ